MSFKNVRGSKALLVSLALALVLGLALALPLVGATEINTGAADAEAAAQAQASGVSHRLIVQLDSPSLAESGLAKVENGRLNVKSASAQAYIAQLEAEQAAFVGRMSQALPGAKVSSYFNEVGASVEATYQITFNGLAVDAGVGNEAMARKVLSNMAGVKAVYADYAHQPTTYTSTALINAPMLWSQAGGQDNAGAGIKIASMDGGLHHDGTMLQGDGFEYPAGWPAGGLGDPLNNNGKIIASRAYFREWDPPSVGDENVWPGVNGTSHGVHTGSTAGGNAVTDNFLGVDVDVTGVAPGAWLMSYRVFYSSVSNDGSFYNVEGIAALEDIVADGADVVNNSWGGGPGSAGAPFDALDQALVNAVHAGVFVSMSAGNAGPGLGTGDHPSSDYINVAASTTSGTFASGRFSVSAPEPVPAELQNMAYAASSFGAPLPSGEILNYDFVTAMSVDPSNFEGCNPWPGGTFDGKAAVISRGACEFGVKVLNAEQAGATFVVVHNHANGGDGLVAMAPGAVGNQATISSIFIGNTNGLAVVAWHDANGDASQFELDTFAFQAGNTPDRIIGFSSRGPSVADTLKPDIAAPGVNIMAQGYTPNVTGEARHINVGQVSGTSMAAPHVAGAAAVLKQLHPDWSNADIKSALMSTSKYMDIYNFDGSPAQPLDMGAGRLDLTNASDPGVILDPPSVSFGTVPTPTVRVPSAHLTHHVYVRSIATMEQTYEISTLYTGDGFAMTQTTSLPGFAVEPISMTLAPGEVGMFTVTFDPADGQGYGDNQGYIILSGGDYEAHLPVWARVAPAAGSTADVLIIDNDFSPLLGTPNYIGYYTSALDELGMSYDVWDADLNFANATTVPEAAILSSYKAVIYFTGDNFYPDGTFTVSTPLTNLDMNRLTEYANSGGIVIAMGQDMSAVLASDDPNNNTFFYSSVLGGQWLQDSVTGFTLPSEHVQALADGPAAFDGVTLDLSGPTAETVMLSGANEVPPVASANSGTAAFAHNIATNELSWSITINAASDMTLTAAHIHTGTVGVNGGVAFDLMPPGAPVVITDTFTWSGTTLVTDAQEFAAATGQYYVNIHTSAVGSGELRGQVAVAINGDGAANQFFVDEITTHPNLSPEPSGSGKAYPYAPLLKYPGDFNQDDGVVAMAHREQPSLEVPGVSYYGRSIYTTFGLEGVNNGLGTTSREELLGLFMDWAMDEPMVMVEDISDSYSDTSAVAVFQANLSSNVDGVTGATYRWDFGDGTDYEGPYTSNIAGHDYEFCGYYNVRVEATDSLGNVTIGESMVHVSQGCTWQTYLPVISN